MFERIPSRLFWKLLLALLISGALSIVGAYIILRLSGHTPPPANEHLRIGIVPLLPFAPLLSITLAVVVTSAGLAWYLSRPLERLKWALRRAAEGRLDTRVHALMSGRRDEIVDLAEDFDRMATRLQQLQESRRILLHDISHELRSPLSRIQAAIGVLEQDPSQKSVMIDRITRESERLDTLIEELLTLHRIEDLTANMVRESVDVIEVLHAVAADAAFEARASARTVSIDAPGRFVMPANADLIYRAFENAVRNAVKFSPPQGDVEIVAVVAPDGMWLDVCILDRGPGVSEEMLETIFHPFTRAGGSESVAGSGLGLAITRRAVEMHGGQVSAARRLGGGLSVRFSIPLSS
ncbi:MAG TPA: HAMP domain-containing sensor histidine kinase [Pseudoxanthomonas sp.]